MFKQSRNRRRSMGSVYRRKRDGLWVAQLPLGVRGGRLERVYAYRSSKLEAEKALAEMITKHGRGLLESPEKITARQWLEGYIGRRDNGLSTSTHRENQRLVDLLTRHIGGISLQRLQPYDVRRALELMRSSRENVPLSQRTRLRALAILKGALNEAMGLEIISRNVAHAVQIPRVRTEPVGQSWTETQARQFLTSIQEHRLYALFALALGLGPRVGEIIALRLEDFDPRRQTLRIERTLSGDRKSISPPKTPNAIRTLHLPDDLARELGLWSKKRAKEKARAGMVWKENGWLFPSEVGTLLSHRNLLRTFEVLSTQTEVPRIRFHDLRHTFTTLALQRGVSPEVVAHILGHASPTLTLQVYRHVHADELRKAAITLSLLIGKKPRPLTQKGGNTGHSKGRI